MNLRNPITLVAIISGIAALGVIVFTIYSEASAAISIISNVLILIATALFSYIITFNNEREQFKKEMSRVADISKRRVDLLTLNLRSLDDEIRKIDDLGEMHRIVSFTLNNLAADSDATVRDIEEIGGIKVVRTDPLSADGGIQVANGIGRMPLDGSNYVESAGSIPMSQTIFTCMRCGLENRTPFSQRTGDTKAINCSACDLPMNIHRTADSSIKVVPRLPQRSSTLFRTSTSHNRKREERGFDCPRCANHIRVNFDDQNVEIRRVCHSCLALLSYNAINGVATLVGQAVRKYIPSLSVEKIDCECGNSFIPQRHTDSDGQDFCQCFYCNRLYLPDESRKVSVEKECPSAGCENKLRFKVSQIVTMSKNYCFECMSILEYSSEGDIVQRIGALDAPKIDRLEYDASGRLCPNCGSKSGINTISNSKDERFHIDWNCKKPFQIT